MSISQNAINGPQVFRALFGILFSFSAMLFEKQLMVLTIFLIIILLSTLKQVTNALFVMLLKSAETGWGKNLFIIFFYYCCLWLVICLFFIWAENAGLLLGVPPFFCPFYYYLKAFIVGEVWVNNVPYGHFGV